MGQRLGVAFDADNPRMFRQLKSLLAFMWFVWKYPIEGGLILFAS